MDTNIICHHKVARLPLDLRTEVNRWFDEGEPMRTAAPGRPSGGTSPAELGMAGIQGSPADAAAAGANRASEEQTKTGAVTVNQTTEKPEEAYTAPNAVFPSAALNSNPLNATHCAALLESPLGQNGAEKSKLIKVNQS